MKRTRMSLICAMAVSLAPTMAHAQHTATSEEQQRDQLNREQAAAAQHQLDENSANQRAYDEAVRARRAAIEKQRAAYEAEKTRLAREHEEAMARWRADVAACKAGHTEHCAPK